MARCFLLLGALLNCTFVFAIDMRCAGDIIPEPAWVKSPASISTADKYFVAEPAEFRADLSEWRSQARKNALVALSETIHVYVNTKFVEFSRRKGKEFYSELQLDSIVKSEVSIPEIEPSEYWIDRDECRMWAMIGYEYDSRDRLSNFYGAKLLYEASLQLEGSDGRRKTLRERMREVDMAIAFVDELDSLPPGISKDSLYRNYCAAKKELILQGHNDRVGLILYSEKTPYSSEEAQRVFKRIYDGVSPAYLAKIEKISDCEIPGGCVRAAQEKSISKILVVSENLSRVEEEDYLVKGQYSLRFTGYDTFTGRQEFVIPDNLIINVAALYVESLKPEGLELWLTSDNVKTHLDNMRRWAESESSNNSFKQELVCEGYL